MKRVLIPTDFSNNSLNAFSYAQKLFCDVEVAFTFFNALWPLTTIDTNDKSLEPVLHTFKSMERQSLKNLEALKNEIKGNNEISNHSFFSKNYDGHLKEGITTFTEDDYDYIVMGSKGATGLKELFMGSITYSIVSLQQKIPLLIIPEKAAFAVPESIGFATDFVRDYSKEELEPLIYLTKLWKATVRMVEVYKKPQLSESQKDHSQHLEDLLGEVEYRFHVVPEFSSLENCINVFDDELEIDLLVMIDYPKTFFERIMKEPIIKKMSFHTTLPFLILPARN